MQKCNILRDVCFVLSVTEDVTIIFRNITYNILGRCQFGPLVFNPFTCTAGGKQIDIQQTRTDIYIYICKE